MLDKQELISLGFEECFEGRRVWSYRLPRFNGSLFYDEVVGRFSFSFDDLGTEAELNIYSIFDLETFIKILQ